jgi:hypothetical protein
MALHSCVRDVLYSRNGRRACAPSLHWTYPVWYVPLVRGSSAFRHCESPPRAPPLRAWAQPASALAAVTHLSGSRIAPEARARSRRTHPTHVEAPFVWLLRRPPTSRRPRRQWMAEAARGTAAPCEARWSAFAPLARSRVGRMRLVRLRKARDVCGIAYVKGRFGDPEEGG